MTAVENLTKSLNDYRWKLREYALEAEDAYAYEMIMQAEKKIEDLLDVYHSERGREHP